MNVPVNVPFRDFVQARQKETARLWGAVRFARRSAADPCYLTPASRLPGSRSAAILPSAWEVSALSAYQFACRGSNLRIVSKARQPMHSRFFPEPGDLPLGKFARGLLNLRDGAFEGESSLKVLS